MPFTARDVIRALRKKGFVEERCGHHIYLHHYHDGRASGAYTYVSHGADSDDLGPAIVRAMRSQLKLETNREVTELVNCPMTQDRYTELLVERGVISQPKP